MKATALSLKSFLILRDALRSCQSGSPGYRTYDPKLVGDALNIIDKIEDAMDQEYSEAALQIVKEQRKKFVPNWDLHQFCPTCKEKASGGCRCMSGCNECPNRHEWHVCVMHQKTVLSGVGHGGDSDRCTCDSTAFYRTEK
jgi:hypothetical protein